jgi:hypothetical protein
MYGVLQEAFYWHRWFAWRPIWIGGAMHWREAVWRRRVKDGWQYAIGEVND